MRRGFDYFIPAIVGVIVLLLWHVTVRAYDLPPYVLPGPGAVWTAFIDNFWSLMGSLWTTLRVTLEAFVLAVAGGVSLAIVFSQSRIVERALYPYAVILQVTPVVAIAPLILIWVGFERIELALVIIAFIVAFFPILSNTTLGLRSTDYNLLDLMRLYGASRWQVLRRAQLPSALPFLLGAMKISGGLALIGAVVAEFVAGSGTSTGLAWRIIEAGNRLEIAKMFAALGLLAALGIAIFSVMSALEWLLLHRWHESALKKQI
jgi:NitT/TauT family transport system permease protein